MTDMGLFLAVPTALVGLVVGSFLNVVIYRVPRRESIAWPASQCPACGHPIRWYDNVPVVSWAALGGKCRDCGGRISLRYPLVESLTGASFLIAALVIGTEPRLLVTAAFIAVLIAITFIDIDHRIIPDRIVLPATLIGLAASIALQPARWWVFIAAALGAGGFLFMLGLIWAGGMGFGDVKMALMMGSVLGPSVIVAMFVAFLVGGLSGVVALVSGRKGRRDKMPFGPFLAAGSALAALWGAPILHSYLSLL